MSRMTWFTEEEIVDQFYRENAKWLHQMGYEVIREWQLSKKLRCDVLLVKGKSFTVIEFKITATTESVQQLAEYIDCLKEEQKNVCGQLIARFFDRGVYALAKKNNYALWRAKQLGTERLLTFEKEPHLALQEATC